ncbi:MAG: hypothetical protein IPG05_15695 [Gemmatimonadetes bacterium]|nr:hypothetical protein [Gemmatimonadota bacterium]
MIIDLHGRAEALAMARSRGGYQQDAAARGLRRLGVLDANTANDVGRMRAAAGVLARLVSPRQHDGPRDGGA